MGSGSAARCRRPFPERFHYNHDIGILHGHWVGGHLAVPIFATTCLISGNLSFNVFPPNRDCSKLCVSELFGWQRHLYGEVALIHGRNKLGTQSGEEQQREHQCCKGGDDGACDVAQTEVKDFL